MALIRVLGKEGLTGLLYVKMVPIPEKNSLIDLTKKIKWPFWVIL